MQLDRRVQLEHLSSEVKKVVQRCRRETVESLKEMGRDLAVHSDRSLRKKEKELSKAE